MNKFALASKVALLSAPFFLTSLAQADTILGIYAGVGTWKADYDGQAGDPSITLKELGLKEQDNNFYYIALEHPIPVIPNIRLQQTDISSKQTADISRTFTIDDTTFTGTDVVTSDFDLSHLDATLYYEILDNWINLDIGLTARMFDGYVSASSSTSNRSERVMVDETLPMLYLKAQFDLPFSGLSAGVEGNYVSYQDSKLTDYTAKISYLFDSAFDIGIEAGYRSMSLTIDEDDITADLDLKGPYAALIVHF
jgi:outer membrane protein